MRNFLFTIVSMAAAVTAFILINNNNRNDYKMRFFNGEYFGSVDTVFLDRDSKMQPKAILNTGTGVFIENAVYGKVEKGDTLYKCKGDFKHYLIKKGDTTIYYADYLGDNLN